MNIRVAWIITLQILCSSLAGAVTAAPGGGDASHALPRHAIDAQPLLAQQELILIKNHGQWPDLPGLGRLHAVTTAREGARVYFHDAGISVVHAAWTDASASHAPDAPVLLQSSPVLQRFRVDIRFVGAATPRVTFGAPTDARFRYYLPAHPDGIAAAGCREIVYHDIYPATDLVCTIADDGVKYAFHLRPGARPEHIRLRYDGADRPIIERDGTVRVRHGAGEIRDGAPAAWQTEADATLPRDVRWTEEDGTLGFALPHWDAARSLVIDPFLQWSTFLGGTLSDYARDIAVDDDGGMILCGYTAGTDFPVTPGALQSASRGNFETFVTSFSRARKLLWSTYYGGSGSEENPQIARAKDGSIYVAGATSSTDLPVSPQATQPRSGGRYDMFLLALTAGGERRWSTYFGGSYSDECSDIAVSAGGAVYVTGGTYSTNFPVTPDAVQTSNAGDYDMFVAQFTPKGTRQWASYIGGWSMDFASGIAVGEEGDVFLTGRTESSNLPGVAEGLQTSYGGGSFDAFVLRISGRTRALLWSSYVGGEEEDSAERIALDDDGNALIAGYTSSRGFPIRGSSHQKRHGGLIDAFLASVDGKGKLRWSTYLGGEEIDKVSGLTVDVHGNIMLAGFTGSRDFPVVGRGFQDEKGGGYDVFLSQFTSGGTCIWGTLFGGETHDIAYGLGTDEKGNSIVVGGTESRGFRTAGNIYQGDLSGLTDAFILRVIFNEPAVSAGRDTTICRGGSATLAAAAAGGQPPYQYSWTPSVTLSDARSATPVARPAATTTYVLAVTDAEGAVARDTIVVEVSAPPVADAGMDVAICPGGSETLQVRVRDGRGPYSFSWSPAAGLNNPEAANPVARLARSTRYVVTVTDALGCVGRDSITVQVHPGVAVETGDALSACADAPVRLPATVTGGRAPYRYAWTPAAGLDNPTLQSPQLLPRSNVRYIVTVTDANGCTARDTLAVTVHRPPVVDAGDDLVLCGGGVEKLSARVSGGKKPYTYAWAPRDGLSSSTILTPEVRPTRSGMYVLTVTDRNGCVVRDSVTVFVHPQPTLALAADVDACEGAQVQIGGQAAGGTPPYRYRWSPAAGLSDASAPAPMAAPRRSTTYEVRVTDANGCEVSASVRVNLRPSPSLRLRDRERICLGGSVQLKPSVRGGKAPYTYAWSPAAGLSAANIAQPVASPTTPVTYTLRVTDARGCAVEGTVDIVVLSPPVVNAGQDVTLCEGSPLTLDARISGGAPPYRAVWSPSAGLSSVRRLDPTVRTTVPRVYTLTVTDKNGCVATDEIAVQVAPPPRASAGADVTLCAGAPAALSGSATGGTPPYRFAWSPAAGLSNPASATPSVAVTQTTRYTLTVTDARGCVSTDEVTVSVRPAPQLTAPRELTICRNQGRRIEVSASGGRRPYRYEWTPLTGLSDGSSATPVANPIQTTTYTVAVTDANGCRAFTTVTVTVLPCNNSDAGEDEVLCDGGEARLGPASVDTLYGARYSWTPAAGLSSAAAPNPVARPAKSTRYVLSKTNRFDCVTRDTVLVTVHPRPAVDAGKDVALCPGTGTELRPEVSGGTPPYSFRWQPADGLDRADARRTRAVPQRSTTYRLTVTDANGCVAEDSLLLRVPDPITMQMESRPVTCQGSEIALGGSIRGGISPYEVYWSPATGLSDRTAAQPVLTAETSARYSVTVTDANGCQFVDTVDLTVHPAPIAEVRTEGDAAFCEGQSLRLNAPPGYAQYRWSDGARGPSIEVREGGDYAVTVTDARGCSAISDVRRIVMHPLPRPVITARGPLSFCEGDSVVLDAGKGFVSYAWSNGATTRNLVVRRAGSYAVRVTGEGGCAASTDAVDVQVRPVPVAAVLQRLDTLIAAPAGRYQWLRDGRPLTGQTGRSLIVERDGAYAVRTDNEEGCSAVSRSVPIRFAAATIELPSLRAAAGDTVDIALRLTASKGLRDAGADTLLAVLPVKKKSMRVISGGTLVSDAEDNEVIHIPGRVRRGDKTLAVLRVVIAQQRGSIPLERASVRWLNGLVRSRLLDGKIRLQ